MTFRVIQQIGDIDAPAWNALAPPGYPFLRHEFLQALETTGCVNEQTGWIPHHALLFDEEKLVAAAPGYLKTHSYGEFVFDFAWAEAAARAGLEYYPKWLIALPFTPVRGPRLLAASEQARKALAGEIQRHATQSGLPGIHILFCDDSEREMLTRQGLLHRQDCQYIWRNKGYDDFDAYLNSLPRRDRKKIRRERKRVREAGITVTPVAAGDIPAADWSVIYQCYADTYFARGQRPYWTMNFLLELARLFPDELLIFTARREDEIVAAAITLLGDDRLYGRHWGSIEEIDCLHFETCYYRCIEYCIEQGLSAFDAGAQGEHKMRRGFEPVATHSLHWLENVNLRDAIADYLTRERAAVGQYIEYCEVRSSGRQSAQQ